MDQTASTARGQGTERTSAAIAAARRAEGRAATPEADRLPQWNRRIPPTDDGTAGARSGGSRALLALFLAVGMLLGIGGGVALLTIRNDAGSEAIGDSNDENPNDVDSNDVAASPTTAPITSLTSAPTTVAAPDNDGTDAIPDDTVGNDVAVTTTSCRFNLLARSFDQAAVDCDNGTVTIDGDTGRWHNDITTVFLSEGTTAAIYFEPRADGTFDGQAITELAAGTNRLNRADAAFGVSLLLVDFTADGQHLHLNGDGRGELTATFAAD